MQIASISVLHNKVKDALHVVHKSVFELDDIGDMDGSQQTHLIDGVLSILPIHVGELDFFDGVCLVVVPLDCLVDSSVAPCAQLFHEGEIGDRHYYLPSNIR